MKKPTSTMLMETSKNRKLLIYLLTFVYTIIEM